MALDGLVISNVVWELNEKLSGGRINKIAQPETDELILTIKCNREQLKLLISASASLPLIYLTTDNKPSPLTAPNFCMLLRKHLNSAKIVSITQPGLERIIRIEIEHLNELGDACIKYLIVEIMGKHSNIIFVDDKEMIIDSIKHISGMVSSVREVLPGRDYFIPKTTDKLDPLELTLEQFQETVISKPTTISKAIYTSLTGISPLIANEICYRSSLDSEQSTSSLNDMTSIHLYKNLERLIDDIKEKNYKPNIVMNGKEPIEFSSTALSMYPNYETKDYPSISDVLDNYYATKSTITRIRQKSSDLRRVVSNALERSYKKYDIQQKQLKDTEKRDKFKVYGELINTYGYNLEPGAKSLTALNYYTNEDITIPLDPTLTPMENSKKFFDKYQKLKRTCDALAVHMKETEEEISHLESIHTSLDIALQEEDLVELKEELMEYGYVKRKYSGKKPNKKEKVTSKPFHYISSDGYHMYVGKNNFQNEELTFHFAIGNDWWFHAKGMAGSHVIVKTNGDELPDRTFEEAGKLAAYYSKARGIDKVEVDYTEKKNIKKPNGSKPGFVVYYTNYSLIIEPDISDIVQVN
ncbi:Rqc2 family fibronectin-binding protein [Anaeromicropila herbilytica]|uniref:Rqc2 homolog RqcH n=1 Tax=Anaeromicropila herbilytica TaxID=2785025 RepID=A0A7R7IDZ7_9FIRM|nr:NFACT RNA binding domain-containing protein [Anaeromicropila herbilytica]BCN31594.1 fibronectin-binding protein A [Anaeromicropila herbilytica]